MFKIIALLSAAVLSLLVYITYYEADHDDTVPISWTGYSGSTTGVKGYLYGLSNPSNSYRVYVSVDRQLSQLFDVVLAEGWSLVEIIEGELWNPRVCAKLPLTITPEGSVVMFEARRVTPGRFVNKLIWFDKSSETIKEAPFAYGDFLGRLMYIDVDGKPYFLSTKESVITKKTIDLIKSNINAIQIVKLEERDSASIEIREYNKPIIKVLRAATLRTELFSFDNNSISVVAELPDSKIWRREENVFTVIGLGNEFEARYQPGKPYETKVTHKGQEILAFKPEAKIFSYILGSY